MEVTYIKTIVNKDRRGNAKRNNYNDEFLYLLIGAYLT